MSADLRDSLAQVQDLLAVMPSQELTVYDANEGDGWPPRPLWSLKNAAYDANAEDDCVQLSLNFGHKNDADALAACFNFLRTHGPALLAMMEDLSPDAGKMGEGVGTVADIPDHKLLERAVRWAARKRGRQPAWAKVADICALGSTYSAQLLRRFNLDPDTGKARAGERG